MRKKIFLLGIFILGLFPVLEQGKLKPGLLQEAFAGGWGDEYGGGGYDNGGSNNYDFLSDYYGVQITGYIISSTGDFYFTSTSGYVPVGEAVITGQFTPLVQNIFPEYQPEQSYPDPYDAYNDFLAWLEEYNNTPPPSSPPEPCNQQAQAAGTAATNLLSQPGVNVLAEALASGLTPTSTGQAEKGFPIYKEDATGNISGSAIQSGTPGNLQVNISIPAYPDHTAVGYVHTHPNEAYPAPSAGDLYQFIGVYATLNTATTAYVIAADGTKYAMVITDPVQLAAFLTANPASTSVNADAFNQNSAIGLSFKAVEDSFKAQGYSDNVAYERAMATVMQNSGITLLKSLENSSTFKKIDSQQVKDSNGNPVKDGNGNNMYLKIDC